MKAERAFFGPAGSSEEFLQAGYKSSAQAPGWIKEYGLDSYEYQCGQGVRGKPESFAAVGDAAKEAGIKLSLHAPYFISLSGTDPEKRLGSLNYIKQSVDAASLMDAYLIVCHTGSAATITREEAMALASDTVSHIDADIDNKGIIIGLETMGKVNQLGTLDEVITLCKINGEKFAPVVDFGHINAREIGQAFKTEDDYKRVFDRIGEQLGDDRAKYLHCHFSKIEYTGKGEKKHLTFDDETFGPAFEPLGEVIVKYGLCPNIICESAGTQARDAKYMKDYCYGRKR